MTNPLAANVYAHSCAVQIIGIVPMRRIDETASEICDASVSDFYSLIGLDAHDELCYLDDFVFDEEYEMALVVE